MSAAAREAAGHVVDGAHSAPEGVDFVFPALPGFKAAGDGFERDYRRQASVTRRNGRGLIDLTSWMSWPFWINKRPVPCDPPFQVPVVLVTIIQPARFGLDFELLSITSRSVLQRCGDLTVPFLEIVLDGSCYWLSFVVRYHDDLNLDSKVVE